MILRIEIDCDNAAFEDDFSGEVARILADVAERIPAHQDAPCNLYDVNGNHVGTFTLASV